jgi:hypothetical protein
LLRGAGVGVAAGALSGGLQHRSRAVRIGKPSASAINMNAPRAPIVIFASRLAVPRGPKAVLESVLEKSAPRRLARLQQDHHNQNQHDR